MALVIAAPIGGAEGFDFEIATNKLDTLSLWEIALTSEPFELEPVLTTGLARIGSGILAVREFYQPDLTQKDTLLALGTKIGHHGLLGTVLKITGSDDKNNTDGYVYFKALPTEKVPKPSIHILNAGICEQNIRLPVDERRTIATPAISMLHLYAIG